MSNRLSGLAVVAFLASIAPALAFEVSSPSLSDGKWASKYIGDRIVGCSGGNVSPGLTWKNPPSGTKSFALTLFDPDAPTGHGFWHWLVWNIPATATGVSEGKVPSGAIQGRTDAGRAAYTGPCPPSGSGVHHYTFTVYALRVERIELDPSNVSAAHVIRIFHGEAIARARAIFRYHQ